MNFEAPGPPLSDPHPFFGSKLSDPRCLFMASVQVFGPNKREGWNAEENAT